MLSNKDNNSKVLMKHNSLIKAKYNLTLVQNRVFELLLYKFQKERDGILSCDVHRSEFRTLIGKEKDKTIKGISDLLESLRIKEILIAEKIKGKDKYKWHRFGLINGSIYNEETDTFTVKATEEIYALIQNYYGKREGHTPINLIVKLGMKNYYAQRLYDLIRVWSGTKKIITYDIDELKELLQIDNQYPLYGDLKRRVIAPAIKELNKTGYFEIDFKENKTGRRVDSIDFIVKDLDKRIYFNDADNNNTDVKEENNNTVDEFYVPNKKLFTTKTLSNFTSDFSDYDFSIDKYKKMLQEAIMIALEKDNDDKVKVKSYSYFKTVLNNKLNESVATTYKPKSKTKQHNVNSTFDKYKEDELEKVLAESQRDKFNDNRIFIPSFPKPDSVKK